MSFDKIFKIGNAASAGAAPIGAICYSDQKLDAPYIKFPNYVPGIGSDVTYNTDALLWFAYEIFGIIDQPILKKY